MSKAILSRLSLINDLGQYVTLDHLLSSYIRVIHLFIHSFVSLMDKSDKYMINTWIIFMMKEEAGKSLKAFTVIKILPGVQINIFPFPLINFR